jgi:ABC-2 type transport system permease protein
MKDKKVFDMKIYLFANRNAKEVLRDPINFFFGLGFPLILLALLSIVNSNIPSEAQNTTFGISNLAPGLAMFGSVFMALFAGMLLSKDRTSSFLTRLFTSPMTAAEFLLGYTAPMIIMTVFQAAITLLAACLFGLPFTVNIIPAIFMTAITSLLFIGTGLLVGSLLNDKAVGGICGALLTNIAGWLSGIFIPIDLIGGAFKTISNILPFYHSVEAIRTVLAGSYTDIPLHLAIVLGYTVVIFVFATIAFSKKMSGDR